MQVAMSVELLQCNDTLDVTGSAMLSILWAPAHTMHAQAPAAAR